MKKRFSLRKLITSRAFITGVFLAMQIGWCVISIIRIAEYYAVIDVFLRLLSAVIAIYLVCKDECPSYKLTWIILILFAPVFGGLLYSAAGNKRPTKKMHTKIKNTREHLLPYISGIKDMTETVRESSPRTATLMSYINKVSGYPVCACGDIRYYPMGEDMYFDMIAELERAEHFIFIEYFIISRGEVWDRIFGILREKADKGVEVRIIYDDMGCVSFLPADFYKKLRKASPNIKCIAFNPVVPVLSLAMNSRDHRKIMSVDGKTAFSGGINLADEYMNITAPYGVWKDTGFMIKGEGAAVYTEMFLEMWNSFAEDDGDMSVFFPPCEPSDASGYIQPFYDTPLDSETLGENVYIDIINSAERYVYIFTPYLILDDNIKSSLCLGAKRGLDIRIVTPGIPDKKAIYRLTRANYRPLLEAGVRIYEYTPGFIHAKSIVSDGMTGMVGTINLDYRSLYLHFECGMLMHGGSAVEKLLNDSLETIKECREITTDNLKNYYRGNMFDAFLRMLAPLL